MADSGSEGKAVTGRDAVVEAAFRMLLEARSAEERRDAGRFFTAAVRGRNAERTPQEVERLERQRGLR